MKLYFLPALVVAAALLVPSLALAWKLTRQSDGVTAPASCTLRLGQLNRNGFDNPNSGTIDTNDAQIIASFNRTCAQKTFVLYGTEGAEYAAGLFLRRGNTVFQVLYDIQKNVISNDVYEINGKSLIPYSVLPSSSNRPLTTLEKELSILWTR